MARPVAYLKTPPDPIEVRIARLRIPKARQKRLLAIMDEAWAQVAKEREALSVGSDEAGGKSKNASAAD
ncbi:MAG TPA: hypothetical protein VLZ50_11030 [Terracidiphilus sp.]|nr:hypothetical protein [Terracidiphilus sp.]